MSGVAVGGMWGVGSRWRHKSVTESLSGPRRDILSISEPRPPADGGDRPAWASLGSEMLKVF